MAKVTYYNYDGQFSLPFKCTACGHETSAIVKQVGTGGTPDAAKANAERDARDLLAAVACPQCGKRDVKGSANYRKKTVMQTIGFLAFAALCAIVSPLFFKNSRDVVYGYGLVLMAGCCAVGGLIWPGARAKAAASCVSFQAKS